MALKLFLAFTDLCYGNISAKKFSCGKNPTCNIFYIIGSAYYIGLFSASKSPLEIRKRIFMTTNVFLRKMDNYSTYKKHPTKHHKILF